VPENKITIYGPKYDGSYILEMLAADGRAFTLAVPAAEADVLRYFQEQMPLGLTLPDETAGASKDHPAPSSYRLDGSFTVKEGPEGKLSLFYEAGPGPMVFINLRAVMEIESVRALAKALNRMGAGVSIDFSYSPAAKFGYGPSD
jgi:hypothetical protein